jgi:hypothetical protein
LYDGLLYKLRENDFPRWALLWLDSYLSERTFKVKWGSVMSDIKKIKAGVPQGSVLGPTLFNLYTLDFPANNEWRTERALYADDVVMLAKSKNWEIAKEIAQESLDEAVKWYRKWRLTLNEDKTQIVGFHRPKTKLITGGCLRIGQQPIEWKDNAKYLGVVLNSNLNMVDHIKHVKMKGFAMRARLAPITQNKSTPKEIKMKMYEIFIRPKILYAAPAWCSILNKSGMETLEINERNCLRSILKLRRSHKNSDLYKEAGITPIREVIKCLQAEYLSKAANSDINIIKNLGVEQQRYNNRYKRPRDRIN